MKKIVFWLIKQYSKTEANRLEIHKVLNQQVIETYNEQTTFGNVYNANVEFIMSNDFIKKLVKEGDEKSLVMINEGLQNSFQKALKYIYNEK